MFVAFETAAAATRLSLELVALTRGPTMPPGCPDGDGDGSKAVMSLCYGSISSSFAPPQESGLQSYELRRRRASLILAEQLRGGLDALQRRRRPDACGSLLAVASRVRAIRSSARREGAEEGGLIASFHPPIGWRLKPVYTTPDRPTTC